MLNPKYTKEELDRMRMIEHVMQLRDIAVDKVLTERQYEAIRHFLGSLIDEAKSIPMKSTTIHFDKNGLAFALENDLIASVNGQPVIKPSEA